MAEGYVKILGTLIVLALTTTVLSLFTMSHAHAEAIADPQWSDLQKLLLQHQPKTVSETLRLLQSTYPDYLKFNTLAYNSLSLHQSSYENPRAIVYGSKANLIITFNGASNQQGFGNLEIVSFDKINGYQFRDIRFLSEPTNRDELIGSTEVSVRNLNFVISKPNPQVCLSCHGETSPRPIWQPYATWPGMYGSTDDSLFRYLYDSNGRPIENPRMNGKPVHSTDLKAGARDTELEGFQKFLKERASNPRYRMLGFPRAPLAKPYAQQAERDFYGRRPNLGLTTLLYDHQSDLIVARAASGPNGIRNLALLGTAVCHPDGNFNQPNLKRFFAKAQTFIPKILDDTKAVETEDVSRLQQSFNNGLPSYSLSSFDFAVGAVPYVATALSAIGLSIDDFAINLRRLLFFFDGSANFPGLEDKIKGELQMRLKLSRPVTCDGMSIYTEKALTQAHR